MDSTFFLFLESLAFFIFLYGIEKETWHGLLIFLSTALFLALSLASFDIETTSVIFNATSGEISQYTVTKFDDTYGYLNAVMALLSIVIGIIKTLLYKDGFNELD